MLYKQYEAMAQGDLTADHRQFYTGNASLRRETMRRVGGFDEQFRRAEDLELSYRLQAGGSRFIFSRSAIGYHYAERSFESWLRIARDYGTQHEIFEREFDGDAGGLDLARRGFEGRHPVVRLVTRVCVGRPRAQEWLCGMVYTGRAGVGAGPAPPAVECRSQHPLQHDVLLRGS